MIGAIIGDVTGSPYEGKKTKSLICNFPLFSEKCKFTDDTVLTIATAFALLNNLPYKDVYLLLGKKYENRGYGGLFKEWLNSEDPQPYNSWGNGSAMRISPIGFFFNDEKKILEEAEKSASVTHNHPDAIAGAQVIALSIYYARKGKSKRKIKKLITKKFGYKFNNKVSFYRNNYKFDVTCRGTVIQAMTAFFESSDFESCIRNSILMGGDTDTIACIAGSLAEAFYEEISYKIILQILPLLPSDFLEIIGNFYKKIKDIR